MTTRQYADPFAHDERVEQALAGLDLELRRLAGYASHGRAFSAIDRVTLTEAIARIRSIQELLLPLPPLPNERNQDSETFDLHDQPITE